MKVMITGDRSLLGHNAAAVAAGIIGQLGYECAVAEDKLELYTGELDGFEAAVRLIAGGLGMLCTLVPTGDGFDSRHELVNSFMDKVVFIHGDPLASSIGKSLVKEIDEDKLVMPVF